jgi:uncharacterized protein (DUF1501 family)
MALTRRQFLKRSGLATAGGLLAAGVPWSPWLQRALGETIGDRYFIVLFLDGGNDGLNTVTPIDNGGGTLRDAYETMRGTSVGGIRLAPDELAPVAIGADPGTGASLGFHPGLANLKALYDLGKVAVIQGCGYPRYSLSHDESRNIWRTGAPSTSAGTGWVGRYLAANYGGTDIPAASISNEIAGELVQSATSVLAIRRVRDVRFPYDNEFGSDKDEKRDAFAALYAAASAQSQPTMAYIGNGGAATLFSSEAYPALHDLYVNARPAFNQAYDDVGSSTARDFREIAKVIYGVDTGVPNVSARFFELRNGGYDTHSDQGGAAPDGNHLQLLSEVGDGIKVFYDDLADMGIADRVCILVWSEFSRRIPQNDNGTDHGSQGPVLVVGGGGTGGVYGRHPNIDAAAIDDSGNTVYSQDTGDAFRSTDFRDVYGTVLKHWLNMPHAQILSGVLPLDGGNAATRWTVENFDLGFLT